MAVTYSYGTTSLNTATHTTYHGVSGTPAGVLVFICQNYQSASVTTSVTYGSVTLSSVSEATETRTTGEQGRITTYFAGSGLPSGGQTVTHNRSTNSSVQTRMYVITVSAGDDTELVNPKTETGFGLPSLQTITSYSSENASRFLAGFSGRAKVTETSFLPGTSQLNESDLGSQIVLCGRESCLLYTSDAADE